MNTVAMPASLSAQSLVEDVVIEALAGVEGRFVSAGSGRWQRSGEGRREAPIRIAVEDEWLTLVRALPGRRLTRLAQVRRWGARALDPRLALPAGVRTVLAVHDLQLWMRGDQALTREQIADPKRLGRWIQAAVEASDALTGSARDGMPPRLAPGPALPGSGRVDGDIGALCEAGGWTLAEHGSAGESTVELPARDGGICHAAVSCNDGEARLRIALAPGDPGGVTPACQAAATLALLRAAGSVRMVRASATHGEDGLRAALEIRVHPPLGQTLMSHTLSALAIAHQQLADELDVLASDTSIARAYLSVQGVR